MVGLSKKRDEVSGKVRRRVELSSTCGPVEKRIRIWVEEKELKDRKIWEAGWTPMKELRKGVEGRERKVCGNCRGRGEEECPRCGGLGQVGLGI